MTATIRNHPEFATLSRLESERRRMVRRPGGRAALAANSTDCFRTEQHIIRDTGCTFNELTMALAAR